jgi:hypothetical protein
MAFDRCSLPRHYHVHASVAFAACCGCCGAQNDDAPPPPRLAFDEKANGASLREVASLAVVACAVNVITSASVALWCCARRACQMCVRYAEKRGIRFSEEGRWQCHKCKGTKYPSVTVLASHYFKRHSDIVLSSFEANIRIADLK